MSKLLNKLSVFTLVIAISLASFGMPQLAEAAKKRGQPKVMLVLDGSGSMWGQIDGKHKITIARETVNGLLDNWNEDLDLGLMSYGHRSKSDCSDIEVLIPPEQGTIPSIRHAVKRMNPKGKTPLSQAVIDAAESMDFENKPAAVILVSDGRETCGLDPCEVGRELRRRGLDFTAHVIGFSLNPEEKENLECLADNTGGGFISAGNADELLAALLEAAAKVARQGDDRVAATLASGAAPITDYPFQWRVSSEAQPDKVLLRQTAPVLTLKDLEPGNYWVEVDTGGATRKTLVTISPDEVVDHGFPLDMGDIQAQALTDSKKALSNVKWTILNQDGQLVAQQAGGTMRLLVDAGSYQVRGSSDGISKDESVAVASGETRKLDFDFRSGGVKLTARSAAGGAPMVVTWNVQRIDRETKQRHKNKTAATAEYSLPAGTYRIEAKNASASIVKDVVVPPAEWITADFSLSLGTLIAEAIQTDTVVANQTVAWAVYQIEDDQSLGSVVHSYSGKTFEKQLPAGNYKVIAQHNFGELSEEISISEGERRRVRMFMNGRLKVLAENAPNGQPVYVKWGVYAVDKDGDIGAQVISSDRAEREFVLPVGDYLVVARNELTEAQAKVKVTAGEVTEVPLNLNLGQLRVQAFASEGGDEVWVEWNVAKLSANGARQQVHMQKQSPAMELTLPAGQYEVALQHPAGSTKAQITVQANGLVEQNFDLDIGYLNLVVLDQENGQPQLTPWVLDRVSETGERQARVQSGRGAVDSLVLPAGKYRLTVADRDAPTQAVFNLAAGETLKQRVVLGLGSLVVKGLHADGKNLQPYHWSVARLNQQGDETPVAAFEAATQYISLPQGNYRLTAEKDGWSEQKQVTVVAGDTVTEALSVFGTLTFNVLDKKKGSPVAVQWRLSRNDSLHGWVKTSQDVAQQSFNVEIPSGDYQLMIQHPAVSTEVAVTVSAGEHKVLDVPLNIGELSVDAIRPSAEGPKWIPVEWAVYGLEADEKILLDSSNGESYNTSLAAGEYLVEGAYGKATISKKIKVLAGENNSASLLFPLTELKLSAFSSVNQPLTAARWTVFAANDDSTPIAMQNGIKPMFLLLAGDYRVEVKSDGVKQNIPLTLKAGEPLQHSVYLRGGINLQAVSPQGVDETFVEWRIYSQTSEQQKGGLVAQKAGDKVRFDLAPGKYWVEAKSTHGQQGDWFTVEAGKMQDKSFTLHGYLNATAAANVDGQPLYVDWSIFKVTENDRVQVLSESASTIGLEVAPGKYIMQAHYQGKVAVREVTIASGDTISEQLVFDLGRIQLSAKYVATGEPVVVTWQLVRVDAKGQAVERRNIEAADIDLEVAAGSYEVNLTHAGYSQHGRVTVEAGKVANKSFILDLGDLEVVASDTPDGDPVYVNWSVYRLNINGSVEEWVANGDKASRRFTLPAGNYRVVAVHDDVQLTQELQVVAGETVRGHFTLSGILSTSALNKTAGEPMHVEWQVFRRGKDGVLGAMVANSVAAERDFILPAGHYRVVAHHEAQDKTFDVDLKPGQATVKEVVMNVGKVSMAAIANKNKDPLVVRWELRRVDRVSGETSVAYERISGYADATVAAGHYVLWAKHGQGVITEELTINPGESVDKVIDFELGILHLEAVKSTGLLSSDLISANWIAQQVDEQGVANGAPLLLGMHKKHSVPLAAGKYVLMAQHEGKTYRKEIDIEAAKTTKVSIEIDEEDTPAIK